MPAQVSIVLRTRDRPVLLRRALRDVAQQTFQDWQLVLVNDGADPDPVTAAIDQAGLSEDARVTRVQRPGSEALGVARALNAGLEASEGAYIAIHDDDDTWSPRFLEATVGELDVHPEFAAVGVTTELVAETVDGEHITERARVPLSTLDRFSLIETMWAPYVPPIGMLLRRAAIDDLGWFDSSLPVLEDFDLTLRMLVKGPLGYVAEPLAQWRHREDTGASGNTVVAAAQLHDRYNVLLRDRYLRGALGSTEDLGPTIALAWLLRGVEERQRESLRALGEHLQAVATEHRLALDRVRGDVIALRADMRRVLDLAQKSDDMQRTTLKLMRAVDRRVADLWSASRAVAKLIRHRAE